MGCQSDEPSSQVLYLKWLPNGNAQLTSQQLSSHTETLITPSDWDIFDYALLADKIEIAVTQLLPTGSKIWQFEADSTFTLLVDCPQHFCTNPLWRPNSSLLFYERRPNDANLYGNDVPEIWQLDVETGVTEMVVLPNVGAGYGMQFSPDGRWFSYASPVEHNLEMFDLETNEQETLHVHTVLPVVWHPNSQQVVAVHDLFDGVEFGMDLFMLDVVAKTSVNLSEGVEMEDGPVAWSPDGAWLAFGRKIPRLPMGKQIWLIRPDGTEGQVLTEDTTVHHAFIGWSPDGEWLLYQQSSVQDAGKVPAIYRLNINTREIMLITENATTPQWWH